jgi:plastocyanin
MFFSTFTPAFGLALLAVANAAVIHDIQVGDASGALTYTPEAISAQPGDQVVFHFHQKNHTATQSSFADPCGLKDGGIDSGFMPVAANATTFPTWTVTINNTQPTWFYCKQAAKTAASHCGAGMVFAVNCGQDGSPNSFTNFKASALAVGAALKAAASASAMEATGTATAAYGGATIPPAPQAIAATETIILQSSTWTTTYSSYPGSPAPTPVNLLGVTHTVIVGGPGQLLFNPAIIQAAPRDTVVFQFHEKNHTVTQSAFSDPCRMLDTNGTLTGFDSGFMPFAGNGTDFPTYNLTINDTTPIWGYCRQKTPSSHCGAGMVFAINSVESSPRNFSAFQALAVQLNGTANATANATSSGAGSTPTSHAGRTTATGFGLGSLTFVLAVVIASVL